MNKCIVLFLLICFHSNAQKFEIEKVTVQDLEQKAHPLEPNAEAAVLYKIGQVNFRYDANEGFVLHTDVKARIKIYKSEGYDRGNEAVSYYIGSSSSREKVSFDNAVTYNLVNGKIEKTKLKSDGIFDTKENKYWATKKIVMPNVKEGSIIEYEYTIISPNIFSFPTWEFQDDIPVDYSEFKTVIPEYFTYSHIQKGAYMLNVQNTTSQNTVHMVEKQEAEGITVKAYKDEYDVKFVENIATYSATKLESLKDEKYINTPKNYRCSLVHELMMTKYPNSTVKSYSSDWADVAKTIHKSEDFGGELSKTGYFESEITALTASLKTPEEKVGAIFNYVKSNVKWNGSKNYWCDEGVRSAFRKKTGNVAEINLMLTAMLRFVGLNANPVLLSTRAHGISLFPAIGAYDYVVCAVDLGSGTILLDATEVYSAPNILPLRDLNWNGLLIDKNGLSRQVPLIPSTPSSQNVNLLYKLSPDGNIEGKVRKQFSENAALEFRGKHIGKKEELYLEELENEHGKIEISDYKRENETDCSKPVMETYSFKKTGAVETIGDKLYFSPMLFLAQAENPFKMEQRQYPVDFGFPTRTKYIIMVELPAGYAIESLPAMANLATEGDFGNFKYSVADANGKLQLVISSEIKEAIVSADAYPILKDFYQKMVDKQNEKIVLKKI